VYVAVYDILVAFIIDVTMYTACGNVFGNVQWMWQYKQYVTI